MRRIEHLGSCFARSGSELEIPVVSWLLDCEARALTSLGKPYQSGLEALSSVTRSGEGRKGLTS
jgi:hypothetical protein